MRPMVFLIEPNPVPKKGSVDEKEIVLNATKHVPKVVLTQKSV